MSKRDHILTIHSSDLTGVTGGSTIKGKGSLEIGPTLKGKVEGEFEMTKTNYESCISTVTSRPDWTPEQIKDICGLPPAQTN